ncbi:phosphoenolpyruvate--protein phosphotransferase [Parahaliea mediterranea]|uniref:phosphoenolpyruvate--protein phosphotransferase n=1 Tax=Parahaliea mediterranea TaxID=651086 RepID=A0A939IL64_9GAMM|nr:phosphoenolpyruvate--protein phosphotransferase [Parahaliea mediterranea]MBN7798061.1 phosphoenolpyruvate--protein phosphotransferase [Parahaliea mediterranea]
MNPLLELTRIVQAAAQASSDADQVELIVESIHRAVGVDVCSLYISQPDHSMLLAASRGLDPRSVGHTLLPEGTGLVGLAARSRHPVNVAEASAHPDFRYVAETHEDAFHSFCGVPLVRGGQVIGVLVVQSREARLMSEEELAFLVTLSTQLALVLPMDPAAISRARGTSQRVRGVKGAPGVGIGKAWICDRDDLYKVPDKACADPEADLRQWHALLEQVTQEVEQERRSLEPGLSDAVTAVFSAYQMLLGDSQLRDGVAMRIRAGQWLPGALRQTVQHFADVFLAMDDPYLRARHEDIHHLGNKLYAAWTGNDARPVSSGKGPVVLVGSKLSVSDIAACHPDRLQGIVSFEGSTLSHTAVLANALGVPAVMGTGGLKQLNNGDTVIVDGNVGQVLLRPAASVKREFRRLQQAEQALKGELAELVNESATTTDGQRIRLFANTGLLADISPGLANGAEGVGLYRTEMPFMLSDTFPSEEEQEHIYRQVLGAYAGKPVYMRTLDIGGDKPLPYFPIEEENPALGWRGIRFCLDNSALLMTQLRAMLRAGRDSDNLHILLPMVSNTGEIDALRSLLDDALAQLGDEGYPLKRPPVGIMVEVPAAISLLPTWAPRLDFVSIGSNDLSQYLLALDRNNPRVAAAYDHLHPAVLREVARVTAIADEVGLPLSLCGEMASDPAAVLVLAGLGIRTLSMSAARIPRIKWLLRTISQADAAALAQRALHMEHAADIRELLQQALRERGLERLLNST